MLRCTAPIVAMAVLMISGCTGGDPADPPPRATTAATTPSATTPSATPTTGVATPRPSVPPPVAEGIDLRPVHTRPCATLTPTQQGRLGLRPPGVAQVEGSVGICRWLSEDGYDHEDYRLRLHARSDPLADACATSNSLDGNGEPQWQVFEPRQLRGLPAVVHAFSTRGDYCEVVVGVGDRQGVAVSGDVHEPDPALCDRLVSAAELAIDALWR